MRIKNLFLLFLGLIFTQVISAQNSLTTNGNNGRPTSPLAPFQTILQQAEKNAFNAYPPSQDELPTSAGNSTPASPTIAPIQTPVQAPAPVYNPPSKNPWADKARQNPWAEAAKTNPWARPPSNPEPRGFTQPGSPMQPPTTVPGAQFVPPAPPPGTTAIVQPPNGSDTTTSTTTTTTTTPAPAAQPTQQPAAPSNIFLPPSPPNSGQ